MKIKDLFGFDLGITIVLLIFGTLGILNVEQGFLAYCFILLGLAGLLNIVFTILEVIRK